MRFERKFRLEGYTMEEVLSVVEALPHGFQVLHPDRQVNNIYLDTPDLLFFHENLSGVGERQKYRLRWYGPHSEYAENPVMEIKIKHNELGEKDSSKMKATLDLRTRHSVKEFVDQHYFNHYGLQPVILSAYLRSYLQSLDGIFRLTIDRKMEYSSMDQGSDTIFGFLEDEAIVVEVKYEEEHDEQWKEFAESFPFRMTKNSKYVNGTLMTVAQ